MCKQTGSVLVSQQAYFIRIFLTFDLLSWSVSWSKDTFWTNFESSVELFTARPTAASGNTSRDWSAAQVEQLWLHLLWGQTLQSTTVLGFNSSWIWDDIFGNFNFTNNGILSTDGTNRLLQITRRIIRIICAITYFAYSDVFGLILFWSIMGRIVRISEFHSLNVCI